jgi:hypothetical protein
MFLFSEGSFCMKRRLARTGKLLYSIVHFGAHRSVLCESYFFPSKFDRMTFFCFLPCENVGIDDTMYSYKKVWVTNPDLI